MQNIIIIIVTLFSLLILWWLRRDMKKQREWREAKEHKIAQTKRRIANKKKAAQNDDHT
jgi:ABC-type nickel/cobalt efflux system permease component RcnA